MTDHTSVWAAFAAAQAEFKAPAQSGVNPHFKSKYSTLGDIFAATMPALHKHGLVFVQSTHTGEDNAVVMLSTAVVHADTGDRIHSTLPLPIDANPQVFGSRLSYYKRYSAAALLGVIDGMDDDGETATTAVEPRKQAPTPKHTNGAQKTPPDPATQATDDWKRGLSPDECDLIESWGTDEAKQWAVDNKACANLHEAGGSLAKIVKNQFDGQFKQSNLRPVLAKFYLRQMEKLQGRD